MYSLDADDYRRIASSRSLTVTSEVAPARPFPQVKRALPQVRPSAPGRSRTYGTRFRRAVLYPLSYWGERDEANRPPNGRLPG